MACCDEARRTRYARICIQSLTAGYPYRAFIRSAASGFLRENVLRLGVEREPLHSRTSRRLRRDGDARRSWRAPGLAVLLAAAWPTLCLAGPPYVTDDPEPAPVGEIELYGCDAPE
jgi:hypothetical protein